MRGKAMTLGGRLLLGFIVAGALWAGNRMLVNPSRLVRGAAIQRTVPVPAIDQRRAMETPFGPMPPPGASSARPWDGFDAAGTPTSFPAFNCWESVNAFTAGEPDCFDYSSWPEEPILHP